MTGAAIAAEIDAALLDVARDVGDGTYAVTLIEPAPLPANPWDTPSGTVTEHEVAAMLSRYPKGMIDGTLIRASDKRMMLSATGPVPETSWRVEVAGVSYAVVTVTPYQPAGVPLYIECQLRA